MPNTEQHLLQSLHVGQEYRLFVALPESYYESEDSYPVIYVADGNFFFSSFPLLSWLPIPPAIVVGIGYPTDTSSEIYRLRARDFLPTRDEKRVKSAWDRRQVHIEPGGGRKFLRFIHDELLAFVDRQFRTKPGDRTFYGYSWGGTFGLSMLFEQPRTFQRYIIGAPDLSWDNQILFSREREYAEAHTELPVKLYLAVGTLDEDLVEHNFSLLVKYHAILQSRNYAGLDLYLEILQDETHRSSAIPVASRGLRAVFR
jgi:predicted alpha/beta superfamily hydrolase